MALLVLSYPTLTLVGHDLIQTMRERHDARLHGVVGPHVTLVFPLTEMEPAALIDHVRRQAAEQPAIPVVFRSAIVAPDAPGGDTLVFLVPDEGFGGLVRLHDRLYTGPLAAALRLDLPFIPHITVGRAADPWECKRLADRLNGGPTLAIAGAIEALDIVAFEDGRVRTIERVPLG